MKRFKRFYPFTNSTNILLPKSCVQTFVKLNPSVWLLKHGHTLAHAHPQTSLFSLSLGKKTSLTVLAHPIGWFLTKTFKGKIA